MLSSEKRAMPWASDFSDRVEPWAALLTEMSAPEMMAPDRSVTLMIKSPVIWAKEGMASKKMTGTRRTSCANFIVKTPEWNAAAEAVEVHDGPKTCTQKDLRATSFRRPKMRLVA
jgi:hypothetical protein